MHFGLFTNEMQNLHFGLFTVNQQEKKNPAETSSFDQGVKVHMQKGTCGLWVTGRKEKALWDLRVILMFCKGCEITEKCHEGALHGGKITRSRSWESFFMTQILNPAGLAQLLFPETNCKLRDVSKNSTNQRAPPDRNLLRLCQSG